MQLTFRHGIIKHQTTITGPLWLQKSSLTGNTIDLNANSGPVVFTVAHYGANYLFEETRSIVAAWGGGNPGSINSPLVAVGQTQYLFWDINLATGGLTRGWTLVPPIVSGTEPLNPLPDTHWFDLTTTRMRVYQTNGGGNNGAWIDKVRLFACVYDQNATIVPMALGSQVDIENGTYYAGNLIFGVNNKPLKQSDGTFVTTESNLIVSNTSGQNVKFDMALVYAQASEEIPKFHLVKFEPERRIGLAKSSDRNSFVSGISTQDLHQEEVGQIVTNGVIRNEQWNWLPAQINRPLFCGPTGEITLIAPMAGILQQVGFIYSADSIYLNLFSPVRLR